MNKLRRTKIRTSILSLLNSALDEVQEVLEEEEYALDNIPENLQGSMRYEETEEYVDLLTDARDNLESVIESLGEI